MGEVEWCCHVLSCGCTRRVVIVSFSCANVLCAVQDDMFKDDLSAATADLRKREGFVSLTQLTRAMLGLKRYTGRDLSRENVMWDKVSSLLRRIEMFVLSFEPLPISTVTDLRRELGEQRWIKEVRGCDGRTSLQEVELHYGQLEARWDVARVFALHADVRKAGIAVDLTATDVMEFMFDYLGDKENADVLRDLFSASAPVAGAGAGAGAGVGAGAATRPESPLERILQALFQHFGFASRGHAGIRLVDQKMIAAMLRARVRAAVQLDRTMSETLQRDLQIEKKKALDEALESGREWTALVRGLWEKQQQQQFGSGRLAPSLVACFLEQIRQPGAQLTKMLVATTMRAIVNLSAVPISSLRAPVTVPPPPTRGAGGKRRGSARATPAQEYDPTKLVATLLSRDPRSVVTAAMGGITANADRCSQSASSPLLHFLCESLSHVACTFGFAPDDFLNVHVVEHISSVDRDAGTRLAEGASSSALTPIARTLFDGVMRVCPAAAAALARLGSGAAGPGVESFAHSAPRDAADVTVSEAQLNDALFDALDSEEIASAVNTADSSTGSAAVRVIVKLLGDVELGVLRQVGAASFAQLRLATGSQRVSLLHHLSVGSEDALDAMARTLGDVLTALARDAGTAGAAAGAGAPGATPAVDTSTWSDSETRLPLRWLTDVARRLHHSAKDSGDGGDSSGGAALVHALSVQFGESPCVRPPSTDSDAHWQRLRRRLDDAAARGRDSVAHTGDATGDLGVTVRPVACITVGMDSQSQRFVDRFEGEPHDDTAATAVSAVVAAPYLSCLRRSTAWSLAFEAELGPLLPFLESPPMQPHAATMLVLVCASGELVKIPRYSGAHDMEVHIQHSLESGDGVALAAWCLAALYFEPVDRFVSINDVVKAVSGVLGKWVSDSTTDTSGVIAVTLSALAALPLETVPTVGAALCDAVITARPETAQLLSQAAGGVDVRARLRAVGTAIGSTPLRGIAVVPVSTPPARPQQLAATGGTTAVAVREDAGVLAVVEGRQADDSGSRVHQATLSADTLGAGAGAAGHAVALTADGYSVASVELCSHIAEKQYGVNGESGEDREAVTYLRGTSARAVDRLAAGLYATVSRGNGLCAASCVRVDVPAIFSRPCDRCCL